MYDINYILLNNIFKTDFMDFFAFYKYFVISI